MVLPRHDGGYRSPRGLRRDPNYNANAEVANTYPRRGLPLTPDPEAGRSATSLNRNHRYGTVAGSRFRQREQRGLPRSSPTYTPTLRPRNMYGTYDASRDLYSTYARRENEKLLASSQLPSYGHQFVRPEVFQPETAALPQVDDFRTAVIAQNVAYPPATLSQNTALPQLRVDPTDTYRSAPAAVMMQPATYSPATMAAFPPTPASFAAPAHATVMMSPAEPALYPTLATASQAGTLPLGVPMLPRVVVDDSNQPSQRDGVPPLNPAAFYAAVPTGNFLLMSNEPMKHGSAPNLAKILYENEFIGNHRFVYSICKLPALVLVIVALWILKGKGQDSRVNSERVEADLAIITGTVVLGIQLFGLHNHNNSHAAAFIQTIVRLFHLLVKAVLSGVTVGFSIVAILDVKDEEDSDDDWKTFNHTVYTHNERLANSAVTLGMSLMIFFLSVIAIIYGCLAFLKLMSDKKVLNTQLKNE